MERKWLTISLLNFDLLEEKKLSAVELAGLLFPFELLALELLAFELLEEKKLSVVELAGLFEFHNGCTFCSKSFVHWQLNSKPLSIP